MPNSNVLVLQTATTTATGDIKERSQAAKGLRSFQAVLTCTSGNCTGTVIFEVSADGVNFITAATITFASAASPQTDGYVSYEVWPYIRTRVTAITGTGASITTYRAH